MYLIAIAWIYVVVMMTIAEAASPGGTLLGAFFTFLLYGLLPLSILLYSLGTPTRKRRLKARQEQEALAVTNALHSENSGVAPDAGSQSATTSQAARITPVREKS